MPGPLVFLGTHRVPEGTLEEWKQANTETTRLPQMRFELIGSLGTIPQEEVAW